MLKKEFVHSLLNSRSLIYLFIFVLICIRFLWLERFPVGLAHDEADVILSAKSYFLFGTDVSGVRFPFSLITTFTEAGLQGLPSVLLSPFVGPVPLSLWYSRFLFVLVNLATGFGLYYLVWLLTKKHIIAGFSFLSFLASPWSFLYSRAVTEAPFALLFLILGTCVLFSQQNKRMLLSIPFFFFSMISYWGTTPVVPIVSSFLLLVRYLQVRKSWKQHILVLGVLVGVVGTYFLIISSYPESTYRQRSGQVIYADTQKYELSVNRERLTQIESNLTPIFTNKYNLLISEFTKKYMGVWSLDYLLWRGDSRATYTLGNHGMIYLVELPVILLGLLYIYKKKLYSLAGVLSIFTLLGPIGSAMSTIENSYIFRSVIVLPALVVLVGCGFTLIYETKRKVIFLVFLLVYSLSIFSFYYFYFYSYSVAQQENHFLGERVVAEYLKRIDPSREVVVISEPYPVQLVQQYMFFDNKLVARVHALDKTPVKIDNILFTTECPTGAKDKTVILRSNTTCKLEGEEIVIQDQKDSGSLFKIKNDLLCQGMKLTAYRRSHLISDYAISQMDSKTFCERHLNSYE